MRRKEFLPVEGHVKHLSKPWNPQLLKGVYECFVRNFNLEMEELAEEMGYPSYHDTELYVILANEEGQLIENDQYTPNMVKGFYALQAKNIESHIGQMHPQIRKWQGRGLKGVCLALDQEYRGSGVGKQLINAPYRLNYDYLWGLHMEQLANLDHWLKRREYVDKIDGEWVTAVHLKKR